MPAYSTLGRLPRWDWLADPLLNTFIDYPEGELARLVFHELAHQVAFAPGDTLFNESFASSVEKIGAERWLRQHASAEARAEYAQTEQRRADFRELTDRYRREFVALYASAEGDAAKRAGKAALLDRLRADYATMKATRWNGYAGYDGWFARANNAGFGVLASYTALVPAFERLFEREGESFPRFYAEVKRIAALPPRTTPCRPAGLRRAPNESHPSERRRNDHGRHPHPPRRIGSAWPRRARWPGNGPKPSSRSSAWSAR